MTADEWLARFGKKPWCPADDVARWWYWTTLGGYGSVDAEDYELVLPPEVFEKMESRTTYPMCKMYDTEAEALADFRLGFERAVAAGWNPDTTPDHEHFMRGLEPQ